MSTPFLTISIKDNADEVLKRLNLLPRAAEIATQRAQLKTAHAILQAEKNEMSRVFANPSPWTLNSMRVRNLPKKLEVVVDFKDDRPESYLSTQTFGAQARKEKAFERALRSRLLLPDGWRAVPGEKAKLDAFGNHSPGEIRQILSWFNVAEMSAGSTQNMSLKRQQSLKKGSKKRFGFEYFVVEPGGRGAKSLHPGIYRRTSFNSLGKAIEPIIIFVRRASYKPRFDFFGVGRRTADAVFPVEMDKAVRIEIERGRA
ncbi:hypothetical protein [Thauera propionica]|uniref:hypothetical protein n=1 Tax=Thauera propionica TaxID=2019431 RepID=UPI0023F1D319|nr:hypothetical protein [Thauera propionica]MDD3675906.1 hypothetical protein [Thauera propionica]